MHFYVIGVKASDVDCLNKADKQECCTVWNSVVDIAQKSTLVSSSPRAMNHS